MRWIGHIVRMDKEMMETNRRPKLSWEDDFRTDVGKMLIQNWSKMAMDRTACKRIAEHAKTHKEL
jgi:hypothetical protein